LVIRRLQDADYDRYSLATLERIAATPNETTHITGYQDAMGRKCEIYCANIWNRRQQLRPNN